MITMMKKYDKFMLMASKCEDINEDRLIAHSGASTHKIYNKIGFIEMKEDSRKITIGEGIKTSIRQ
jgi:hypothetical protein